MDLVSGIVRLKSEFRIKHAGAGHLQEPIPLESTEVVQVGDSDLDMLHRFVDIHPAYHGWQDADFLGVPCRVHQADINQYWLDSIKHDASCQSFYPTWMLSAYALSAHLKAAGFSEVVDIGSGDGRIAYCARLVGMRAHGLEIDRGLVQLQHDIARATGVAFEARVADATRFDYHSLDLRRPAFLVSGLPEMGGEMLARSVIDAISTDAGMRDRACLVLMGKTGSRLDGHGWGETIRSFGLEVDCTIRLPTHWTAEQADDTPHIRARLPSQAGRGAAKLSCARH